MRNRRIIACLATGSLLGLAFAVNWRMMKSPARPVIKHSVRNVDPRTSCGPVSLAVVSEYLGKSVPIADFHEETGAGDLGFCSMADLVRALKKHGFAARAVRFDTQPPPFHNLPMVLFVDGDHFLAAIASNPREVVVIDPPKKPQTMPWDELKPRWQGEAVVVGRSENDVREALNLP